MVRPLAGEGCGAGSHHPGQLVGAAGLHLEAGGECLGLSSAPDVVSRGKPDIHRLIGGAGAAGVDHLVQEELETGRNTKFQIYVDQHPTK